MALTACGLFALQLRQMLVLEARMRSRTAFALTLAGVLLASSLPSALASTCHSHAVKAKGAAGLLEATAKSRARSAWIKKVRTKRKLGPAYAAWLRALSPAYACIKVAKRIQCEASAVPCKLPMAEAAASPPRSK
ncbi:MAG: hypothetical protein SFW09_12650 [Hyphomicrobiaceae bacterium]|nr:hypothetical protein [Hyphomicrobiaceae bacterium]